jgi:hypothetical protein
MPPRYQICTGPIEDLSLPISTWMVLRSEISGRPTSYGLWRTRSSGCQASGMERPE